MQLGGTKKFFLYVAIGGAIGVGIMSLVSIWGNFGGEVVIQGIRTYLVTLLAAFILGKLPIKYESFDKVDTAILNIGVWLGNISILLAALLSYLMIWRLIQDEVIFWKMMSSILIVNFMCFISVFSLNKWGAGAEKAEKNAQQAMKKEEQKADQ